MLSALVVAVTVLGPTAQAAVPPTTAVVSGIVVEQGTGAPIAGAQVTMMKERQGPPPGGLPTERPPQAATDAAGRFVFRGVPPGRYRFTAQKAGFALPFGPGPIPAPVDVAGDVDSVQLVLPRGGVVVGRVLDASGEPVANAMVVVMRPRPEPPARAGGRPSPPGPRFFPAGPGGQTNELGEFRMHSLAAGDYIVRVMARPFDQAGPTSAGGAVTYVPTYAPGTADAEAADRVTVQAGATANIGDVRMLTAPSFRITGTVVDSGGRPVAGALLRLAATDAAADMPPLSAMGSNRSDERGAFSIDQVVAGAYTLIAIAPVVLSTTPGGAGAGMSGGMMAFNGGPGSMVTTETRNGQTVQFRDEAGTRVAVTVANDHVTGLQIVVRR